MTTAIDRAVARWTNPDSRPLFKGSLIDSTGCMCAQGDVLFNEGGYTAEMLRQISQRDADTATMSLLGISRAHSILLRTINDKSDGQPQNLLTDPASVLGDKAEYILAFWRHLDGMSAPEWAAARAAARDAAWAAAWAAAGEAAGDAAGAAARAAAGAAAAAAARDAAWEAAGAAARAAAGAAAGASNEIQGADVLLSAGKPLYFLKAFGFDSIEDLPK